MKFAEHLNESAISEWKDKYIDYKAGKKWLKQFNKDVEKNGESTNQAVAQFVNDFVEDWLIGIQLHKCNEFYHWLLRECETRYCLIQDQVTRYNVEKRKAQSLAQRLRRNTFTQVRLYDDHDSLQGDGKNKKYGSIDTELKSRTFLHSWKSTFTRFLEDNDLMPSLPVKRGFKKINSIINFNRKTKETFAYSSYQKSGPSTLREAQIMLSEALIEFYSYLQLVKTYRETNVTGFRKMIKKFDKICHTNQLGKFMRFANDNFAIFRHFSRLNEIIARNQLTLNIASSRKKISDRETEMLEQQDRKQDSISITQTDDPLSYWENSVSNWYTQDLVNSPIDKKKHNVKLKKLGVQYFLNERMIHNNNRSTSQMFFSGIVLGISSVLIIYTLYLSIKSSGSSFQHEFLFPLWSGWYATLFIGLLFLVDCFIWHRTGINYRFIMFGEVQSRNGTQYFNNDFATTTIPLKLYFTSFFILPCAVLAALSFHFVELTPYGFIYAIIVVFLFTCPSCIIPYWDKLKLTKEWLVVTGIRLIFSGLYPVEFSDFFLGDIVCSLTYSLSDVALFFCYYSPQENRLCGSKHSKSMGVLSCLPNFWRAMQCLRRFADSGDWFPHLVNAGKYLMGIGYYVTLCAYRLSHHSASKRIPFILFGTIYSLYTSIWDLVMDWSLFQTSHENTFLRDDLYLAGKKNWKDGSYKWQGKVRYYFAMVFDVVIRFQWIVYAVAPQTIQQNAVTSFIVAITEVIRRFVWIIFRVENEHVANVHIFRVTGNARLPYPVMQRYETGSALVEMPSSSAHYGLSDDNHVEVSSNDVEEPSATYHSMFRRTTRIFEEIPWAHAKDFQRPKITNDVPKTVSESDSEGSDSESNK